MLKIDDVIEIITLINNLYGLVLENLNQLDLLKDEFSNYHAMSYKDIPNDI